MQLKTLLAFLTILLAATTANPVLNSGNYFVAQYALAPRVLLNPFDASVRFVVTGVDAPAAIGNHPRLKGFELAGIRAGGVRAHCEVAQRVAVSRLTQFLVGLLPVLGVLALFSVTVAPASDLVQGLAGGNAFAKIADLGRHRYVAGYMLEHFLDRGRWSLIAPTWIVLAWLLAWLRQIPEASCCSDDWCGNAGDSGSRVLLGLHPHPV
jgi:hypothetical protein